MKLVLNLHDRVRVELTEEGQKILSEFLLKNGAFPTAVNLREFTFAELMAIFGPHVKVNMYGGIESPSPFVAGDLALHLKV